MLLTREPLHRFKSFRGLCSEAALSYIGSALLLPIIFREQEGYLVLAVRESARNIEELLSGVGLALPETVATAGNSQAT